MPGGESRLSRGRRSKNGSFSVKWMVSNRGLDFEKLAEAPFSKQILILIHFWR